jgi:hypothetical protein
VFEEFQVDGLVWYHSFLLEIEKAKSGSSGSAKENGGGIKPAHVDILAELLVTGKM